MSPRSWLRTVLALGVFCAVACQDPTQISVRMRTDAPCDRVQGATLTGRRAENLERSAPSATSTRCEGAGDLGVLVSVPAGEASGDIGFRLVVGIDKPAASCTPDDAYAGCIVQRRILQYRESTPLDLTIMAPLECKGVTCDAQTTCSDLGACVSARVDAGQCSAGADCTPAGLRETVFYVSAATGADDRDARTPQRAVATIAKAVELAKSSTAPSKSVHVCNGMYTTPLDLDSNIAIRGSYDCKSWKRSLERAPEDDPAVATVITSEGAMPTLAIHGNAVGRSMRVDGLVVRGSMARGAGMGAVWVDGGASPVIARNRIVSHGTLAESSGAPALATTGSAPEVRDNVIVAEPDPVLTSYGDSVGIDVSGAAPNIHDNEIVVSSGASQLRAIGVRVHSSSSLLKENALRRNSIRWRDVRGRGTPVDGFTALGVLVEDTTAIDVVSNSIIGGVASVSSELDSRTLLGIFSSSLGRVRIQKNRIHAGDFRPAEGAAGRRLVRGVRDLSDQVEITNNLIVAGGESVCALGVCEAAGIVVQRESSFIVHNTIVTPALSTLSSCLALVVGGTGTMDGEGAANATVENNIIVSQSDRTVFTFVEECRMASFARAENNAFVGAGVAYSGCNVATHARVADLNANVNGARGNLSAACAEPGANCAASIFTSWTPANLRDAVLEGALSLRTNGKCNVLAGAVDASSRVVDDIVFTPRIVPASIGAFQAVPGCSP